VAGSRTRAAEDVRLRRVPTTAGGSTAKLLWCISMNGVTFQSSITAARCWCFWKWARDRMHRRWAWLTLDNGVIDEEAKAGGGGDVPPPPPELPQAAALHQAPCTEVPSARSHEAWMCCAVRVHALLCCVDVNWCVLLHCAALRGAVLRPCCAQH
jgi:hypothetical protein